MSTKNITIYNIIFFMVFYQGNVFGMNDILTYKLNGGKIGDLLLIYSKCKLLSHQKGIKLYYQPFDMSNCFALHLLEPLLNNELKAQYKSIVEVKRVEDIDNCQERPALFVTTLYTLPYDIYEKSVRDEVFGRELKNALRPLIPVKKLYVPENYISVAVHIRKPFGPERPPALDELYDSANLAIALPRDISQDSRVDQRFLPCQYYIDQIMLLSELLDNRPIYVKIFTNDEEPENLQAQIKRAVAVKSNIIFSDVNDAKHVNVLDELFAMAQCDCLIKGTSHFSYASQLIGMHALIIEPRHSVILDNKLIVDLVGIMIRSAGHCVLKGIDIRKKQLHFATVYNLVHSMLKFDQTGIVISK